VATAAQIAALRLLIAQPDNVEPYTDAVLGALIDAESNQYTIAYQIWTQKAASVAGLVDISEGGSSRKMGDLYEQSLSMASNMRVRADEVGAIAGGPGLRISQLRRR
jgi:hypothetical protein